MLRVKVSQTIKFSEHGDALTLREVGDSMGIAYERFKKIEVTAILKMAKKLKQLGMDKRCSI